jgi:hypothetical protein
VTRKVGRKNEERGKEGRKRENAEWRRETFKKDQF